MALVLCLDDDDSVARLVADVVEFCKHEPILETNALDAVSRWLREPQLKAVCTDYMMPRMDGIEVLALFQESRPDVRRVLITAAPQEEAVRAAERSQVVQLVIAKPPSIGDLRLALAWL